MRRVIVPVLIIALSLPLVFGMIPRNRFYGFRSPAAVSSDAAWYRANSIAGIVFTVAGTVWLVAALLIPGWLGAATAERWLFWIALWAMLLALAVSLILTRNLSK